MEGEGLFPLELQPAVERVRVLFDVAPTWVPVTYSNEGLMPWHGGFMDPSKGIQLREAFRTKERYLGLYSREELVAHELVHAGRAHLNEPKFEEIFAYWVSGSLLRRWLGPMIERPWEVWAFLGAVMLPLFADFVSIGLGWPLFMPLKVLPAVLMGLGVGRRVRRHRTLSRLLRKLEAISDARGARAIAYRLTDEEIIRFSKREDLRPVLDGREDLRKYLRGVEGSVLGN
ncbi:MAG: hypothetical protein AB7F31_00350 [Parachlamydiales bacterium]